MHVLLVQIWSPAQGRLQPPQWSELLAGSMQTPLPQSSWGERQLSTHAPATHAWFAGQATPQAPQFRRSFWVSAVQALPSPFSPPGSALVQATSEQAATKAANPKPPIDFRKLIIFRTLELLANERRDGPGGE